MRSRRTGQELTGHGTDGLTGSGVEHDRRPVTTGRRLVGALVACAVLGYVSVQYVWGHHTPVSVGISVIDDETGDAVPASPELSSPLPEGGDLERVSVESTGHAVIVTFRHVDDVERKSGGELWGTPLWVVHFWDEGRPLDAQPDHVLYVSAFTRGGVNGPLRVLLCDHGDLCLENQDEVTTATARVSGPFMRVELPVGELDGLSGWFQWAASVTASPSPNDGRSWYDCVPDCPEDAPGYQHRQRADLRPHPDT